MPTLPDPLPQESHQARQIAESFGTDAERYDRARPDYPAALVDRVVAAAPGTDVLDVGCGTGIAARQFQAAGCRVLGVDPDARMADLARRAGVEAEVATFETWDPAGRMFDAVVAAQAWHWVDPVTGADRAARVLRPGGLFAAFWNVSHLPPDLGEAVAEVYRRVLPDSPMAGGATPGGVVSATGGYEILNTKAADGIRQTAAFHDPQEWRFEWERPYTRDEWLDMIPTTGFHTRLPQDTLREVLTGLGAAVDAAGGGFTMRYTTQVLTAARLG
ncbi:class I SAM-dependent methyltransferase [Sphaerisporangium rubeum]|uniref:SAM-dependent methyltransferase n=1 Tax=Sphaerisporangium rubeum TaxID=321317 RepID=A0A7X0IHR8_9ACTN|nr:class I SAM-dependent methyltransferase [Sphaerisporangium rubeum]MBB6473892.1 SAM-dependent methyltransferase [Sphaerisporangium rubeum]